MCRPTAGNTSLGSSVVVGFLCLDGLQVRKGSTNEAARGGVVACDADESVESEIGDVGLEFVVEEDVGRFDVSVDKLSGAALVEVGQAPGGSLGDSEPCGP